MNKLKKPSLKSLPQVAKKPKQLKLHGDTRIDSYFWLRDKENPDVLKYLKEENAYFSEQMKPLQSFKNRLLKK